MLPVFLGNLTASSAIIGAAESIRRYGWLVPQLFVANYVQTRRFRKPVYLFAGFGRAAFVALLAGFLFLGGQETQNLLLIVFFVTWIGYSFVSGLAGVPYNDVVGRVIPSQRRSTFLAIRFLGGGLLAVGAGLLIRFILAGPSSFPFNYALIFALGATTLAVSSVAFSRICEPAAPVETDRQPFRDFLRGGWRTFKKDRRFRLFYFYELLAGVTAMALPFYVLQARRVSALHEAAVGTLLAVQQAGNVVSNPLWGVWGDRLGKLSLLKGLSWSAAISPMIALAIPLFLPQGSDNARPLVLAAYGAVFFFIGSLLSGETVGHLGYLIEISPDEKRAEYSGFMNTFVAPVRLLPVLAGALVDLVSFQILFALALFSVVGRLWLLAHLEKVR